MRSLRKRYRDPHDTQRVIAVIQEAPRNPATPAPRDPTLLSDMGIGVESTAGQYVDAIRRYLLGKSHPDFLDYKAMVAIMGARHVVGRS